MYYQSSLKSELLGEIGSYYLLLTSPTNFVLVVFEKNTTFQITVLPTEWQEITCGGLKSTKAQIVDCILTAFLGEPCRQ